jgi:feruloyl esterase
MYDGPGGVVGDSRNRGFEPGGELAWKDWHTGTKPGNAAAYIYVREFLRDLVYGDPSWDFNRFDFKRDRPAIREKLGSDYDARDPDLSRFKAHGGKLIMYHGWADPALQPRLAVDYFENVQRVMGETSTADFMRLYMVPGMYHCVGGPGTNDIGQVPPAGAADPGHSVTAALEAWVEQGRAPEAIVAAKYKDDLKALFAPDQAERVRTRPVCPYPQIAKWSGQGSTDDAANFRCEQPEPTASADP